MMVENSDPEKNATSASGHLTEIAPPSASLEPPPKPKKWGRGIGITLAVLVLLGLGLGAYLVRLAGNTTNTVSYLCAEKEKQFQAAADLLKAELSAVTINGHAAATISASKNGDCLTGTGAVSTASFIFSAPDIANANAQVAESLHVSAPPDQAFTPENQSNSAHIDFVSTHFKSADGKSYQVYYYLQTPINCQDFSTHACQTDAEAMEIYGVMHKPVSKVAIKTQSTVTTIVD